MKRRKAETLVEFLMASLIFAEIMTSVLGFIANQTQTVVNISNRDIMMFHAQRFVNMQTLGSTVSDENYSDNDDVCKTDNVKVHSEDNVLTVSRGTDKTAVRDTMEIRLKQ